MHEKLAAAGLFLAAAHVPAFAEPVAKIASPDGSIVVSFDTDNDKRIRYGVARRGKVLIARSLLGFILTDSDNMVRGFNFQGSDTASGNTTWEQPCGERRFVTSHYNELLVRFKQPAYLQRQMNIRFPVFDNGVGFRNELPDQPNLKTMRIADEATEFAIAQPGHAWWMPGGEWNRYEQIYQHTAIDAVSTATIYRDGESATFKTEVRHDIASETRKVKKGDALSLWLAPGGGAAIRIAAGR